LSSTVVLLNFFTVACDSDGTKIATGIHEELQPLVDMSMLSIPEKDKKGRAPQVHDAGAEYL